MPDLKPINARLPKETLRRLDDICAWYGYTKTQALIEAINVLHRKKKPKVKEEEDAK